MPNEYSAYYKRISNAQLLSIINHPNDYQPLALEAAHEELKARQLTEEDLHEANEVLQGKLTQQERNHEKIQQIQHKSTKLATEVIDLLNPVQEEKPTSTRLITMISIGLSCILLYAIISEFRMIVAMIDDIPDCDFSCIEYFFPFILGIVATCLFWLKRTIGWMMLTFYIVFNFGFMLMNIIMRLLWTREEMPGFDFISPGPPIAQTFLECMVFFALLMVICRKDIREVFKIDTEKMLFTLGVSGFILFLVFYFS